MNYRHAFHAGGFVDVVKHLILTRLVDYLKRKPAAFRVIDIHAGAGLYDLKGEAAERTSEWKSGVGRLYREGTFQPLPLSPAAEALIAPWRKALAAVNDGTALSRYPGSPEIARRLVRDQDRLALNEVQPEVLAALKSRFAREKRVTVTELDGWIAARALAPTPERRGLMLIDPPYEAADDARRALEALVEAHRRFATGALCLWYPVKAQADANALARRAGALGLPKTLRAEITIRRAEKADRLNGCGLILVNAPWRIDADLRTVLPELAGRLAEDAHRPGRSRVEWLVGEEVARPGKGIAGPEGRVRQGGERST
jgi:23S rRNA (adenine2030-N6)-methyltransferase